MVDTKMAYSFAVISIITCLMVCLLHHIRDDVSSKQARYISLLTSYDEAHPSITMQLYVLLWLQLQYAASYFK